MHRYIALLLLTVVSPLGADPQKGSDARAIASLSHEKTSIELTVKYR
jgi:hypothetical protein